MPLEEAQMLCTAVWQHAPEYAEKHDLYKPVHQKHPCTIWAAKTRANYNYALALFDHMQAEYSYRYGRRHASNKHYFALQDAAQYIPEGDITPHPECFKSGEHTDLKQRRRELTVQCHHGFVLKRRQRNVRRIIAIASFYMTKGRRRFSIEVDYNGTVQCHHGFEF